ncbi:MAG: MFS transporter [Anaerolineales bacterium]|uniref:MFS transporter n=1 Tax=Candidatus Desulfolinea nitratireducens TaxID=2841698 RepID=A0A8J6NJN0_9CHLR|nr:MFS transporter [Candidatus Desulfolinea nitratireducens]MBL6961067.1 MFS transporter [Anaerolineales bacterium]
MFQNQITRAKKIYAEYPPQFWVVVGASFVDHLGGALLYPFFALYVTKHFDVGMTEVGILFAIFSVSEFFGSIFGGALTDLIGRKKVIIIGLIVSAFTSVGMGLVNRLELFYLMAVITGLFADMAGPARQAMITDLLPEEKRADGFGIMRVAMNLTVAIGPAIGGFIAARSYMMLFAADAISSTITAFFFYKLVAETLPKAAKEEKEARPSFADSFRGYAKVFKDNAFIIYMLLSMVVTIVYMQMYGALPVFLRDIHQIPESGFGMLMSLNATMVVLFQFVITRKIGDRPPMLMLALGALIYAVGFVMYGFTGQYAIFMVAMAIITIGEMVVTPVAQALVAKFSPEEMRGRYMAVFGISWLIPGAIGPLLAGLVMDAGKPLWVWYASGILAAAASLGFVIFHQYFKQDESPAPRADLQLATAKKELS